MSMDMNRIENGWDVYGSDGEKVGDISEVGSGYFIITKGWLFTKDIYVPTSAVSSVENNRVYLNVAKDQVENMGWDEPPTGDMGSGYGSDRGSEGTLLANESTPGMGYQNTGHQDHNSSYGGAQGGSFGSGGSNLDSEGSVTVPRYEETLSAEKTETEAGRVRISKNVTEEEQSFDVPVSREEVQVHSRQVDQSVGDRSDAFSGDTIEVPVREEQVNVQKDTRLAEELEIEKRTVQDNQRVSGTVRREDVNVERVGDLEIDNTSDRNASDR